MANAASEIGEGDRRLGAYDGVELWSIRLRRGASPEEQALISLHERLHHELQHTTLWGLITRFAGEALRAGIGTFTARKIFWIGVMRSREVHETYATTLAAGIDDDYVALVERDPEYAAYYRRGLALLSPSKESWPVDRIIIEAVLRACMQAVPLQALAGSNLSRLRVADFDRRELRPDDRLAVLTRLDLTPLRRHIETPIKTVPELEE